MFPGYVLLNMVMNDDTWYVVRNTRGVTRIRRTGIEACASYRGGNDAAWYPETGYQKWTSQRATW